MDHIMDMKMIKKTSSCLLTGKKIPQILSFGLHPYADTFIPESLLHKSEPSFPLEVYLNEENGNVQLGCITNDFERYNLYDYSYTSSNSNFSINHWKSYYKKVAEKFEIDNKFVIEIGSNDGFLLSLFSEKNEVLGIDSSKEMVDISNSKNIKAIHRIFNKESAQEIVEKYGNCDFVIANNVFNHSNNPLDFAFGVSELLNDSGIFIFELPYWMDTVKSGKFDQIYHEHITYFTMKFSYFLLKKAGMQIIDFEIVNYHGGSLRIFAQKKKNPTLLDAVKSQIDLETTFGLFDEEKYEEFQKKLTITRNLFLEKIIKLKIENPNAVIIGVGAAAKANTFLNFYRLDNSFIDFITDSSIHKIGKYTPLTRIPIVSDEIFSQYDDVYALILSWNISEPLKNNLLKINPKIKFISHESN